MIRLKVKEVAERKGVGMRKLSRLSGLAYSTIRTVYKFPHQHVSTATLDSLAQALEVDVSELIESVEDGTTGARHFFAWG